MKKKLSVFQTVPDLYLKSGGPSISVVELNNHLNKTDTVSACVFSQCVEESLINRCVNTNHSSFSLGTPFTTKLGFPLAFDLYKNIKHRAPDFVHNHGMWHGVNFFSSILASHFNIPYIIQPHGMLEPWALNFNRTKKLFAIHLYQRRLLNKASGFVATSEMEYHNLRSLRLDQPIAVIPNGITGLDKRPQRRMTALNRQRNLLFLSRIHPKKGLLNLLQAWASIDTKGWVLNIAGPAEGKYLEVVLAEISRLGIDNSVTYLGELYGDAKTSAYTNADIFVLPTFSENFGIVVAEALQHGIPVITTKGTPWADIESCRAGWWIDIGVDPLRKALLEGITLSDEDREAMGNRGYQLVQRFDWSNIALSMADFYQWLKHRGSRPGHVFLD